MHNRKLKIPPEYIYPPDPWRFVEKRFNPDSLPHMETLFSLGNGYLGMRGTFIEDRPVFHKGNFINAFYESWPIVYGEEAFGFAKTGQTIVNVTNSKIIKLYVDDEPFYLPTANLLEFERALNMHEGTLERIILWETAAGKKVQIKSQCLVSFEHRHLAAISYEVTILNAEAPVVISSEVICEEHFTKASDDPRKAKTFHESVLQSTLHSENNRRIILCHSTRNSKMGLSCGVDHEIITKCPHTYLTESDKDSGKVVISIDAKRGESIKLIKYISYHTSRSAPPEELAARAERTLNRAISEGFEKVLEDQHNYLQNFWHKSDVQIEGDPEHADRKTESIQQVIRFNLFHILQAAGRAEGAGIAAKGLTGQAYEGQYFWDTEIYVLPFLIYTEPRIAKNLLKYRLGMLDKARERAKEVNQDGALFPWRTINGEEASAYYAAGTAQYHINADIAYALRKYVEATGDETFLYEEGAEMLVETARLWYDLGFFSERKGSSFCIHGVTGPDEYNTVVNNNTYTNLMAREHLWYATEVVEQMRTTDTDHYKALVHQTNLKVGETADWKRAADNMYIPFDESLGINPQDDNFLDKEQWDFTNVGTDKYPLLLNFHPLVIYRHQVIKQADIVLAMFLLGHEFSRKQKKLNFDYYAPLTTGDSSLSACIESIMAYELGYFDKALKYTNYAFLMDIGDVGGNVKDGCHIASMGGTWMVMVYGIAGMRDFDGQISFNPKLPKTIKSLRFPLLVRGQRLEVNISHDSAEYSLESGKNLVIYHQGEEIILQAGKTIKERIKTEEEQ